MINDATQAQIAAADPDTSTWLSANAGSGKTRVLTDRVARLLLKGVPPERVLCLTYTKAAASEMQNRLFQRLGAWAMLDDGALERALDTLGIAPQDNTRALRRDARTLFARAIETPGGLKIQTIHSFCAALLRRFPLEAGVSPQFSELDDRAAAQLRADVLDQMAEGEDAAHLSALAAHLGGEDIDRLLTEIASKRDGFARPLADVIRALGAEGLGSEEEVCEGVADARDMAAIAEAAGLIDGLSSTMTKLATRMRHCTGAPPGAARVAQLSRVFLYANRPEFKPGYLTKAAQAAVGPLAAPLEAVGQRVEAAAQALLLCRARDRSLALHRFANAFLTRLDAQKQARGVLDFDDLIRRAEALLTDPRVAQWVLFRLDGGIDHILVDEAQDTAPRQWDVIRLLAAEFTAGVGARSDTDRTIFVVGDKKQSIYSFQGADPDGFDRMKAHFHSRLSQIAKPFQARELLFSFRSSVPILRAVDAVFERAGAVGIGDAPVHRAFHGDLPGRVDLWPGFEKAEEPEETPWFEPLDISRDTDHQVILARRIALWIKAKIGTPLPGEKGVRPIHAGDFLILVQRRSPLFHEIIRACKTEELPIAGADRLKIGGELAVRDITALLRFLATPEDDLSLAAALRSPLFGLSEGDLYELAQGRGRQYLWQVLRNASLLPPDLSAMLDDLLTQADFLRPYDLIERLLTRHRGRQRLIGRLGAEAEDGVDALLAQALSYEAGNVPSLTGFLGWMEEADVEIKRQAESAGARVRVMSVHGAKGLEAPIVILPDTAKRDITVKDMVLRAEDGTGIWKTRAEDMPAPMTGMVEEKKRLIAEERMRLLYVAMTRAERWLVVAGGGDLGKAPGDSWYRTIEAGLVHEAMTEVTEDELEIRRFEIGPWPDSAPKDDRKDAPEAKPAAWAFEAPAQPGRDPGPISPSDLGGAKALPGEGEDETTAKARGNFLHKLLEVLPDVAAQRREAVAKTLFEPFEVTLGAAREALLEEARGILDDPRLAHVFSASALAEVPITAPLPAFGGAQAFGVIDRLIDFPDHVLAIDFKSNRRVPATAAETPEGVLRQLAAYRDMLTQTFRGKRVEMAILWTRSGELMPIPPQLLVDAMRRAATS